MPKQISVYLQEDRREEIESAAREAGASSVSAWIRYLVVRAIRSGRTPKQLTDRRSRLRFWQLPLRLPEEANGVRWVRSAEIWALVFAALETQRRRRTTRAKQTEA